MKASMSPAERSGSDDVRSEQLIPHEAIPDVLKQYPQWVCWRYVDRGPDHKPDKRPVNPHNLHNAGVNWPNTWSNFPHTYTVYLMHRAQGVTGGIHGIGFVLTADDPFVGLDLDRCVDEGHLSPWAQDILNQVPSYTEVSPSGTGLRILVTAPDFTQSRRRAHVEIYSRERFLTLTGNHLAGTPDDIRPCTAEQLAILISAEPRAIPLQPAPSSDGQRPSAEHDKLWERIFAHDRFGEQHRRRFLGDTSLDGGDHSLTVIRLLNTLSH